MCLFTELNKCYTFIYVLKCYIFYFEISERAQTFSHEQKWRKWQRTNEYPRKTYLNITFSKWFHSWENVNGRMPEKCITGNIYFPNINIQYTHQSFNKLYVTGFAKSHYLINMKSVLSICFKSYLLAAFFL